MKLDTVIKLYGRNVMEQLRLCHNENEVMQVVSNAGYSVTPNEAKEILALMTLLTGGLTYTRRTFAGNRWRGLSEKGILMKAEGRDVLMNKRE